MTAAEMRGQDMQDAPEDMPELTMHYPVHPPLPIKAFEIRHCSLGPYAVMRNDLITEAECQRRIDAAVTAEREAAKSLVWTLGHEIRAAMLVDEDNEQTVLDMVKATAAAIRARGQK